MPPGHVESNSRGLSLFADYSESFHHKAQVPQTPKITPSLRKFYNPKLSEEQIENQVKSVHELKNFAQNRSNLLKIQLFFRAIQ